MGMLLHFNDAERELNAKLKPHLHSIHASLKLDQDITDANVAILKTILDDIYEQIKRNDPLFKKICRRLVYTGSYYIRLRTKKADEFDINLVLDLPFRKGEFTILDERPGYVGYKVSLAAVNRLLQEGEKEWVHPLLKLINGENRLMPERVKRSLQSAFDRVLQTYVIPSGLRSSVARIRPSQSGPAKTFRIILKDGQWIDVDLVPVIEFCYPNWPSGIEKKDWMDKISPLDQNWFLVPKSPMSNPSMPDGSHLWRLDFQNMENRLIQDYGCVKPIIRLLKTTRDSYTWNLSSYSLKTFVMHQLLAKYDRGYWDPKNQGILFITGVF
ncbi:cyclic GMP-AMP synthase isoform X4 [Ixodes scapularis]|uniref:cyclic GMP-AMP synthase isoform X4 n=1 Tax=Ixodes scapularis TaxID=6945 RepID=UPI001C383B3E|nr:cyclic GMP-AMP synthase isoform X4 [Ixodes scapularis]